MTAWLARWRRWRIGGELLLLRTSAWPLVGLVLLVLAGAWVHTTAAALRDDITRLRAAAEPPRSSPPVPLLQPGGDTPAAAPALLLVLPPLQRQTADLRGLFDLARQHGLAAAQADYAGVGEAAAAIEGVQVTMPLAGSYPAVRRFAEAALRTYPHLSIEQLDFERSAIAETALSARLRLTLWYRGAVAREAPADVAALRP